MAIFSKFFWNFMSHIIGWNGGEKIKSIFELFIKQNIEFKFVLFLIVQTLLQWKMHVLIQSNKKRLPITRDSSTTFWSLQHKNFLNKISLNLWSIKFQTGLRWISLWSCTVYSIDRIRKAQNGLSSHHLMANIWSHKIWRFFSHYKVVK